MEELDLACQLRFACTLALDACTLRKLPIAISITAQNLIYRFCGARNNTERLLKKYSPHIIAAACVLVSSKVHERALTLAQISETFYFIIALRRKVTPLPLSDVRVVDVLDWWQQTIAQVEMQVLVSLGFNFDDSLGPCAHDRLLRFTSAFGLDKHQTICQRAWNYVNDSTTTGISQSIEPRYIAAAAIFLATRESGVALPDDWLTVTGLTTKGIAEVSEELMGVYQPTYNTPIWLDPLCEVECISETLRLFGTS